jgi:hypothetical protein
MTERDGVGGGGMWRKALRAEGQEGVGVERVGGNGWRGGRGGSGGRHGRTDRHRPPLRIGPIHHPTQCLIAGPSQTPIACCCCSQTPHKSNRTFKGTRTHVVSSLDNTEIRKTVSECTIHDEQCTNASQSHIPSVAPVTHHSDHTPSPQLCSRATGLGQRLKGLDPGVHCLRWRGHSCPRKTATAIPTAPHTHTPQLTPTLDGVYTTQGRENEKDPQ